MAPVPKDGPDRVHMYALFLMTIEFLRGVKNLTQCISSSLTYMQLSNGSGDRQKFYVPLSKWSLRRCHPCTHAAGMVPVIVLTDWIR